MSGHSKWSKIKRKKGATDAARSKVFSRVIKEINIAARDGGGDPESNARLSLAIDNAKAVNMPKDNIERAIKKGIGELDGGGAAYEEISYEGYGPGGIAYFVDCTTDNQKRTVSDVRHAFSKRGGNLGTTGSVGFLFEQKGVIIIPSNNVESEQLMLDAIEAGAEDIKEEDDILEVITVREDLFSVKTALEAAGYTIESANLQRVPTTQTKVDAETALSNFKLIELLEENDDVNDVFTNMEVDEEALAIVEREMGG
ncbi:MAG: YebC/PmpR family DNA-binding transcriptional regulator [Balneolales bacterium]